MRVLLVVILIVFIVGCSDNKSPIVPVISTSEDYLGKIGTTRDYKIISWMFQPNSDVPYYEITDSLKKILKFDTTLIKKGIVKESVMQETLIPYESDYNIISDPSKFDEIYLINENEEIYNLEFELDALFNDEEYYPSIGESIAGKAWVENEQNLTYYFGNNLEIKILEKPLETGSIWIRNLYDYTELSDNPYYIRRECKVVELLDIEIQAGKFEAYKVEVSSFHSETGPKSINSYEYYVNGIGLVLIEYDIPRVMRYSTSDDGKQSVPIYFRSKYRKELINYNIKVD